MTEVFVISFTKLNIHFVLISKSKKKEFLVNFSFLAFEAYNSVKFHLRWDTMVLFQYHMTCFGYRALDEAKAPFGKAKIKHGGDDGGFNVFCLAQLTLELETVYQDLRANRYQNLYWTWQLESPQRRGFKYKGC